MAYFGWEAWVALSAIGGAGILAILQTLARHFEHDREAHDLHVRAAELKVRYVARLKSMRDREKPVEVDVIGSIEPEREDRQTRRAA